MTGSTLTGFLDQSLTVADENERSINACWSPLVFPTDLSINMRVDWLVDWLIDTLNEHRHRGMVDCRNAGMAQAAS